MIILASESDFKLFFHNSLDLLVLIGFDDRFKLVSPSFERILGWKEEEVISKPFQDFIHPDDQKKSITEAANLHKKGKDVIRFEIRYRCKDGSYRWISWSSHPIPEKQIVVGIGRDITERKQAEIALKESENMFRIIVENSRDGINMLDLKTGKYVFMSPAQVKLTGFSAEEINSISAEEAYNRTFPDDREVTIAQQKRVAAGEDVSQPVEYRWKVKSGEYRWFSDNRNLVRDDHGQPIALVGISRDITERKKTEDALQASEEKYRQIVETAEEGIWTAKPDGTTIYVNQKMADMLGYLPDEIIGKVGIEFLAKGQEQTVMETRKALDENLGIQLECKFVRKDGAILWTNANTAPVFEKGQHVANISMHTDITKRKKAEEALQSSEKQKNDILESITDGFVAFDKEWRYTYVNSNAARILHATKEELIGKVGIEVFPNASKFLVEFKRAVSSGRPVHFEEYYPEPLNIWYECHCYPSQDGLTVFFSDITQRKKSEEAIRKSQEMEYSQRKELEALMETVPATIWISHDPKCLNMTGNKATYDLVGLPKNANVSETAPKEQRPANFFAYDTQGKLIPLSDLPMQVAARTGKPVFNSEFEFRFEDGRSVWVYGNVMPLLDNEGNPQGAVGAYVDITERKKAEEKLEDYQKNLEKIVEERTKKLELSALYARNLIEASLDPLVTISIEGKITDVNKATELATGCSRKELIGSDFSDYFVEPEKAKIGYKTVFAEGVVKDYALEIKHKNGRITNVFYNATVYRNDSGEIQGVFAAARDITEQKKAEAEAQAAAKKLKDSERLATIGATAGMVGHDIRNPLQAIIGDLYLLKDEVNNISDGESKESAIETIDSIDDNINYINKIVSDLQDYARPLKPAAQKTDLTKTLTALLETAHVPKKVKTILQIQPEANQIISDVDLLKRIFTNLITNAAQAMPNGGKLTINATKTQDNTTIISVEDTGVGIAEEIRPNLFTPTFTTKSKGQGFGLAVVKRLSEALGGTVSFESEVGKGTTFTIRLPPPKN